MDACKRVSGVYANKLEVRVKRWCEMIEEEVELRNDGDHE